MTTRRLTAATLAPPNVEHVGEELASNLRATYGQLRAALLSLEDQERRMADVRRTVDRIATRYDNLLLEASGQGTLI